jgi:hypothetical protein
MFIGHFGVGLAVKKLAPKTSLGTLFLSVQFVDLLWPMFLLLGMEHVRIDVGNTVVTPLDFYDYPITHSLVGAVAWAVLLGLVYFGLQRYPRGAWVVGAGVLSHWVLDAISHRPDLLLMPGGKTHVGLCLWNSLPATVIVEGAIFFGGLALYLRSTTARDRTGRYALWALMAFLVVAYVGNLWGPPPPSVNALALVGLGAWLLVAWGYWIDRHREAVRREG